MKANELRQKSQLELQKLLQESREKLRQLRFGLVSGKVKNVREIRKTRRDVARMLTVLNQKSKAYPERSRRVKNQNDKSKIKN